MRRLFTYLFIGCSLVGRTQVSKDSLEKYGHIMLESKVEQERIDAGSRFTRLVDEMLENPESFLFPVNQIKSISIIESPDRSFRILTWNTPLDDGHYLFSGRIQLRLPYSIIKLKDVSAELKKPESKVLKNADWYGAIYYQITQPVKQGKNKVYLLLGWNGNTAFSNKKLIETIQVSKKGEVLFGVPLLYDGIRHQNRAIFEYAENASMSIKYFEKKQSIIFDHLAPSQPSLEGMREFYGPDFTYDSYRLKKGKWFFEKNIDARNESENKGHLPKAPERGLNPPVQQGKKRQ